MFGLAVFVVALLSSPDNACTERKAAYTASANKSPSRDVDGSYSVGFLHGSQVGFNQAK
jgi:hypothetical protein